MRRVRAALTGCLVITTAIGCAPSSRKAAHTLAPASQPVAAGHDVDREVIEAALGDLLTLDDSPVAMGKAPPTTLRFAAETATYPVKVEQILLQRDEERWAALSPAQRDAAKEAAADVVRRHEANETFAPFTPSDVRVKLQTDPLPATIGSVYERPILAWPPGYSRDGRYAIVFLSIPWSIHHADGTYLLEREGEGWKLVLRQFVYYV